VEQAPGEDCAGGEEQADCLVAMESAPLGVAEGDAILLDVVRFFGKIDHGFYLII
jgi:hypothetical protein